MSDSLARIANPIPPALVVGTIDAVDGASIAVCAPDGSYRAVRAPSCLVEPRVGEQVLLALHDDGAHVIAVLKASETEPTRLVADGDIELAAPHGRVTVTAEAGIRLATAGSAEVAAETFRLDADQASLSIRALAYIGKRVVAQAEQVKTVSRSVEQIADRVVQRLERAYRFVEKLEHVRANYLDYSAHSAVHIRGATTIVKSTDLTKVDGPQIHVG